MTVLVLALRTRETFSTFLPSSKMEILSVTLKQVSKEDKDKLWKQFAWIPKFARGLGISFGLGFGRVSAEDSEPFLDFAKKSEYFLEGCGYGFGLIEKKLSKSELDLANNLFTKDSIFKRGYAESAKI